MAAIVKWDPWGQDLDDLFGRYARTVGWPQRGSQEIITAVDWCPRVDISETDKEFIIKAEIPDVKKDDVKVTIDKGVLTIRGEKKQEKEEKGKKFHRVECQYGSFTRSFTLPDNVDDATVKATFKDGMLNVQIQKTEKAKPKAIEVKVG